jgi:arginyl-tRNA synthetase
LIVDCLPNQLCLYLYELAGYFMQFYEAAPILNASTSEVRNARLQLCQMTSQVMQRGLGLLGIETLEEM